MAYFWATEEHNVDSIKSLNNENLLATIKYHQRKMDEMLHYDLLRDDNQRKFIKLEGNLLNLLREFDRRNPTLNPKN